MRLRKPMIKTELSPSKESLFRVSKRQVSEGFILSNKYDHQLSKSNRPTTHHHMRFSSLQHSNYPSPKLPENIMNSLQRPWKKINKQQIQKAKHESIKIDPKYAGDVNLLINHITNLKPKGIRKHVRNITEPCVSRNSLQQSRRKKDKKQKQCMDKTSYNKCCNRINEIFQKIRLLKQLGYADEKINEWILLYCDNRRPYMKDIFMKNMIKSVYTLQEEYEFERNSQVVKQKIKYKIEKGIESFYFIQVEELDDFCRYIEQILIQKNNQRAREVQSSIIQKMSVQLVPRLKNKFFVFTKKDPAQVSNFLTDLTHYQHKYGDFLSLAKVNKLRFLQLNRVQKNLKKVYQSLLEGQIKKIIKGVHQNDDIFQKQNRKCKQTK